MKGSRVAKRYAQAAFETALDKKQLEIVEKDLERLAKDYADIQSFRELVDSPVIADFLKLKAFKAAYQKHLQPLTFNFVALLINKNRVAHLPQVIDNFKDLLDDHRGVLRGQVFSVVPLSDKQLKSLKISLDKETGKNVILTSHIDESLLGGFVVRLNDMVFDTSLSNKLKKLKQNLIEA